MIEDVRIGGFEEGDRAACLLVFESNVPEHFRPDERAEFEAFLDALPGPYLVVRSAEGEVVGCGGYALRDDERQADLCWGMIRSDLHGLGLGRRLTLERLERAMRHPGVETVALSTSQLTRGFYERMGFEVVSTERDGFGPGLDRCDMRADVASMDLPDLGRDGGGTRQVRRRGPEDRPRPEGREEGS